VKEEKEVPQGEKTLQPSMVVNPRCKRFGSRGRARKRRKNLIGRIVHA